MKQDGNGTVKLFLYNGHHCHIRVILLHLWIGGRCLRTLEIQIQIWNGKNWRCRQVVVTQVCLQSILLYFGNKMSIFLKLFLWFLFVVKTFIQRCFLQLNFRWMEFCNHFTLRHQKGVKNSWRATAKTATCIYCINATWSDYFRGYNTLSLQTK